jgi:hypothetical protein
MSRTYHHRNNHDNMRWWAAEPKAWRKHMKHKKRRQSVMQCKHKIMRGNINITWPLDKKPWIYYW